MHVLTVPRAITHHINHSCGKVVQSGRQVVPVVRGAHTATNLSGDVAKFKPTGIGQPNQPRRLMSAKKHGGKQAEV